jgi:ABC-type multidrug transport system permease subunit
MSGYDPLKDNSCLEENDGRHITSNSLDWISHRITLIHSMVVHGWRDFVRILEIIFLIIFLIVYALIMFIPYWLFHNGYRRGRSR